VVFAGNMYLLDPHIQRYPKQYSLVDDAVSKAVKSKYK